MHATLRHHSYCPARPDLKTARWTTGGGGGVQAPRGTSGGRTGGVGGERARTRLAVRNHWRGQRLQSRKTGRRLGIQRADGKGVRGFRRNSERAVLGSAMRRVE